MVGYADSFALYSDSKLKDRLSDSTLLIGASWQEADAVRKLPPEGVLGLWVSVNVQVIASTKRQLFLDINYFL